MRIFSLLSFTITRLQPRGWKAASFHPFALSVCSIRIQVSVLLCKTFFSTGSRLTTAVGPTELCSIFDTVGDKGCGNLHPTRLRILLWSKWVLKQMVWVPIIFFFLRLSNEVETKQHSCLKVSALRCRPQTRNPPVQMDTAQGQGRLVCYHRRLWRFVFSNVFVWQFEWGRFCMYTYHIYILYIHCMILYV